MTAQDPTAFDFPALKRALETSDAEALLAFYAEDAEMTIIDRNRPPGAPMRLLGKHAIAGFWRDVCAREMTHAVGEEVATPQRAAFIERCAYPDGCNVVSAMTLALEGGRIRRHLTVQAWDEVSCTPG
jgi:hypothetical protein